MAASIIHCSERIYRFSVILRLTIFWDFDTFSKANSGILPNNVFEVSGSHSDFIEIELCSFRILLDYIDDYILVINECRINYCWTKLRLFLDVRREDHWGRSSCTRKSWRVSAPAGKAELSRVRFPQLSVKVSVHSEIYSLKEKTYRPSGLPGKTYRHTTKIKHLIGYHNEEHQKT